MSILIFSLDLKTNVTKSSETPSANLTHTLCETQNPKKYYSDHSERLKTQNTVTSQQPVLPEAVPAMHAAQEHLRTRVLKLPLHIPHQG